MMLSKKKKILILAGLGCALIAVAGIAYFFHRPVAAALVIEYGASVEAEFYKAIERNEDIVFRSFNGNWIGMDGDTDIQFMPEGAVRMVEYGYGVQTYDGTYTITDAKAVNITLPTFGSDWPTMQLGRDDNSLLLINEQVGFVFGNRGGATLFPEHGSYWPFRPAEGRDDRFHK